MATDVQKALIKIEGELSGVVQKTVMMSPEEFIVHATKEVTKARDEEPAKARKRLLALQKSVLYSSDIIEDTEADSIKVPVCVIEQTAVEEQENTLMTPGKAAALNPSSGTVFEEGFVAKKLEEIESMLKAFGKPPAPPTPPKPPTPPGAAPAGEEEETEEAKKAKGKPFPGAAAPFGGGGDDKDKDKEKTDKIWPDDMNEPGFVQKGEVKTDSDWGTDPK